MRHTIEENVSMERAAAPIEQKPKSKKIIPKSEQDEILEEITQAASDWHKAETNCRKLILVAIENDCDDDDEIIEALEQGGWSTSRARQVLREVSPSGNAKGQGRKKDKDDVQMAEHFVIKYGGVEEAVKHARAILRELEKRAKAAKAEQPANVVLVEAAQAA